MSRLKKEILNKLKEYAGKMGKDHLGGDDIASPKRGGLRDFDGYDNVQYNKDMPMDEMQVVNKKTGKDITKHVLALLSGKIDNKKFEKLTGLKKESMSEGDGLWANIRAKKARGEKPAHKNSKAHKDAVKAGNKINKNESVPQGYNPMVEDKKQIKDLVKKVKHEKLFYDVLDTMEKKYGKNKYRIWLEKSLKDCGVNPKHYDYRTNAAAEEKLYQLGK